VAEWSLQCGFPRCSLHLLSKIRSAMCYSRSCACWLLYFFFKTIYFLERHVGCISCLVFICAESFSGYIMTFETTEYFYATSHKLQLRLTSMFSFLSSSSPFTPPSPHRHIRPFLCSLEACARELNLTHDH
jgi:hypothetical protein